ncbi:hypothetical protein HJG60_008128 [Phyllostomus discolor]|uniref:Uncharacterized protein n=1 Tax=Phyllostomus discolor TaxID=89673 RepID=A0A833Z3S9_9CHIR|nr:hypothetical protein HJG60_008128 [Phyllostomus discolor]
MLSPSSRMFFLRVPDPVSSHVVGSHLVFRTQLKCHFCSTESSPTSSFLPRVELGPRQLVCTVALAAGERGGCRVCDDLVPLGALGSRDHGILIADQQHSVGCEAGVCCCPCSEPCRGEDAGDGVAVGMPSVSVLGWPKSPLPFFCKIALAIVAQWIEPRPAQQGVAGSTPSQGTCLGCGPGPQ